MNLNFTLMSLSIYRFRPAFLLLIFAIFSCLIADAQELTEKQLARISRSEINVERAQLAVTRLNDRLALADSLYTLGSEGWDEHSTQIKLLTSEMKSKAKEYKSERKSIERKLKSKSREEVNAAKAELKHFDANYKEAFRRDDLQLKSHIRLANNASKDWNKGRSMRKDASKRLKDAEKVLETAQRELESIRAETTGELADSPNSKRK